MSLITYIAVALAVIGVLLFVIGGLIRDADIGGGAMIIGFVVLAASLITLSVWAGGSIGYRMTSNECRQFADQTQVETKMVRYNTTSFDCLVRSASGWVSKSNYWNSEDR